MTFELTKNCSVTITTELEKQVFITLLDGNISSLRLWDTYIYLYSDSIGRPDIFNGMARVKLRYTNAELDTIEEEDAIIDARDIKRRIEQKYFTNTKDGDFSYIDWDYEFVTITTDLAECNSCIIFKINDIPNLNQINTDICGEAYPNVENIGYDEDGKFHAIITSKSGKRAALTVDMDGFLNSSAVEI